MTELEELGKEYSPLEVIYGRTSNQKREYVERNDIIAKKLYEQLSKKTSLFSKDICRSLKEKHDRIFEEFIKAYDDLVSAAKELKSTKESLEKAQREIVVLKKKTYAEATTVPAQQPGQQPSLQPTESNQNKPHPVDVDVRLLLKVVPKPTSGWFSEQTKKCLKSIDLSKNDIVVESTRKAGKNGIMIQCERAGDVEELTALIKEKMGDKLEVERPKKRNPTFTMILKGDDFSGEESRQRLKSLLILKNDFEDSKENPLKVVFSRKTKDGNSYIVMEMGPGNYAKIKDTMMVYVNWGKARIREQNPLSQCYHCHRFWHKAGSCRDKHTGKPAKCLRCGGQHESKECKAEVCCSNCSEFNKHTKGKKLDTGHLVTSGKCQMFVNAIAKARSSINYM